jgi:GDP-L-fucose synthase
MSRFISPDARIFVAGHRGLAGSAIVRRLRAQGYENLLLRTHGELDLEDAVAVERFFAEQAPEAFSPIATSPPTSSRATCAFKAT